MTLVLITLDVYWASALNKKKKLPRIERSTVHARGYFELLVVKDNVRSPDALVRDTNNVNSPCNRFVHFLFIKFIYVYKINRTVIGCVPGEVTIIPLLC